MDGSAAPDALPLHAAFLVDFPSDGVRRHTIEKCAVDVDACGAKTVERAVYDDDLQVSSSSLLEPDLINLHALLGQELAQNTLKTYRAQWNNFESWASIKGVRTVPAQPAVIAAYLAERAARDQSPATLRVALAAITFVHLNAGEADPCGCDDVKRTLRSVSRRVGRSQKQAMGLTAELFEEIKSTAYEPRIGRGGRVEKPETARVRADVDVAVIGLMRDAMLRVSEAAVLKWRDFAIESDGTGRLFIRRSKTDPYGEGAVAFISAETVGYLRSIRRERVGLEHIFQLRANQISNRIKKCGACSKTWRRI